MLVPDEKVRDWGFHDVTLLDMGDVDGQELEQLRCACKIRYNYGEMECQLMCSYLVSVVHP